MDNLLLLFSGHTIAVIVCNFIFKSTRIRKRHIKGINLLQILISSVCAITFVLIYFSMMYEISQNELSQTSMFSDTIFFLNFVTLLAISCTGLGMHFSTKVISYHLPDKGEIIRINKFIHITLSHLLIYTCLILNFGNFALYESIHPFKESLTQEQIAFILLVGLVCGAFSGLGFARAKTLLIFHGVISILVSLIILFATYENFYHLPFSIFAVVSLFLTGITQFLYYFFYIKNKPVFREPHVYNTI